MGKVKDYCNNFAEVKKYLKDPSNMEVNTKDATIIIKKDKSIKLTGKAHSSLNS